MTAFAPVPLRKLVSEVSTWNPLKLGNEDEAFEYIDLSAIDQERKAITGARTVHCAEAPSRARQLVQEGDVLVSTVRPNLNGVAMVPPHLNHATASTGFCVIRANRAVLEPGYAFHWVKSPAFVSSMAAQATGASYPAVSDRIVLNSEIPLPPLSEQRRIAAILEKADSLRTKRREGLAQLDRLAQSIFIEMFGDPAGANPSANSVPLVELALGGFQNGAYFPKEAYSDSGVEMVHMSDAFGGIVRRGQLRRVTCDEEDLSKYSLEKSDVLIARRSLTYEGAAKPCRVPDSSEPLLFESSFIRIRPDLSKVSTLFLFHYLNNERVREKFVRPFVTQSTISGINQANLAKVPVLLPPSTLQRKFELAVASLEGLSLEQCRSAAGLDQLFVCAQDLAFRGEL